MWRNYKHWHSGYSTLLHFFEKWRKFIALCAGLYNEDWWKKLLFLFLPPHWQPNIPWFSYLFSHVYYHWARRDCLSFKSFPLGHHFHNSLDLCAWLCINLVWRNYRFISAETGLVATRQECFKTNNHKSTFLKKAEIGVTNLSPRLF